MGSSSQVLDGKWRFDDVTPWPPKTGDTSIRVDAVHLTYIGCLNHVLGFHKGPGQKQMRILHDVFSLSPSPSQGVQQSWRRVRYNSAKRKKSSNHAGAQAASFPIHFYITLYIPNYLPLSYHLSDDLGPVRRSSKPILPIALPSPWHRLAPCCWPKEVDLSCAGSYEKSGKASRTPIPLSLCFSPLL